MNGLYTPFPSSNRKAIGRASVDGVIDNNEKNSFFQNARAKTHTLFMNKISKIDTLFVIKTAEKPFPLRPHIPIYMQQGGKW